MEKRITRRDFLKISALGSTSAVLLALGLNPYAGEDGQIGSRINSDLPSGWGDFVEREAKNIDWERVGGSFVEYVEDVLQDVDSEWKMTDIKADGGLVSDPESKLTVGYRKRCVVTIDGPVRGNISLKTHFTNIDVVGIGQNNLMNCMDVHGNLIETSVYAPTLLSMLRRFGSGCKLLVDVSVRTPVYPGGSKFPETIDSHSGNELQISRIDVLFEHRSKKVPKPPIETYKISDDAIGLPPALYFVHDGREVWSSVYAEPKTIENYNL